MELAGNSIGIIALGMLAWQDFRSRSISWWLLPIVVAGLLLGGASRWNMAEIGKDFLWNVTFLSVQFVFVWLWMSLRQRKFVRLIDRQIGLGDVLFLLAVAFSFSPGNFILFYTIGLLSVLLIALVMKLRQPGFLIPLAGALAVPLLLLCAWRLVDPSKDFYNDDWLLQLLGN